jgi:hypothetical protein
MVDKRSFRSVINLVAVLAVMLSLTLGCNLMNKLKAGTNTTSTKTDPDSPTFPTTKKKYSEAMYESADRLAAFVAEFKKAVGSDNPNLLDIAIYDEYVMVKVQDPNKPDNIDGYTYRDDKLSEPAPVKLIGGGNIKENVFPMNDINLAALPALTTEIAEKLKDVEGGKMIGYTIRRRLPFKKDIEISGLTSASRKSVSADADRNGKLTKFEVR